MRGFRLTMPSREFAAVGVLAGAMSFRMFGVFVALPVAAMFADSLPGGGAGWAAGIALGGYGITQAMMQIPAGMLADFFGRKPVMIFMLLIFAAGGFVAAAAETIWALAGGRLLQGVGAVAAVSAAWISDITAPERRARAMLVYGAGIALSFVASLFVAAPLAGAFGFAAVFSVSGWLGIFSAAAVACLPSPPKIAHKTATPVRGMAMLFDRQIAEYAAAAFIAHYALAAVFLRTPALLQTALPLENHWQIYAAAFAISLAVSVPLIFAEKKIRASAAAFILTAAGAGLILSDGGLWQIGIGLCIFFAGFVVLEATIPAGASRAAPSDKRGVALGAVMSMEFLGMFCGAVLSGVLLDFFGTVAVTTILVLLLAAGFVIMSRSR